MIREGTFGTCRLAKFRSMLMVVEEFKVFTESTEKSKGDVLREAKVIESHRGLPLLFGIDLTNSLQFSFAVSWR